MHDYPRQRLAAIIAQHGPQTAETPARLRGLLNDYLQGKYTLESSVLVAAAEEHIPEALSSTRLPKPILFSQLATRLQHDRALTAEAANWAVESWALALGVIDAPYQHPPGAEPPPSIAPSGVTHFPRWWAIVGYLLLIVANVLYLTDSPWIRQHAWVCLVLGELGVVGILVVLYDTIWPTLSFVLLAVFGLILGDDTSPDWPLVVFGGFNALVSTVLLVAVRARREPVPIANARLRPETGRQLQAHLRYYARGQLLYAPFMPLIEQYHRIRRAISGRSNLQQLLLMSDDILSIEPMEFSELVSRFQQALHDYRAFYDRLLSRMVIGTPLMTAQILQQAGLDPAFEASYTQRLESTAMSLQAQMRELEIQRHTLLSHMPQLRGILSRGGISDLINMLLEFIPIYNIAIRFSRESEERFLLQFAHALQQYAQRWESLARQIDTAVIPAHLQVYEEITQQSFQKATALFDQFDTAIISLRPLLRELEKSNRQAAKMLRHGMTFGWGTP